MPRTRRTEKENENQQTLMRWLIALYIRESRPNTRRGTVQQDESGSIENQREWLMAKVPEYFAQEEEAGAEVKIVDVYIDKYKSGTTMEGRPEFQRMLHDVDTGKINVIVTKNLSRAFRNVGNQSTFLQEYIVKEKIRFISFYNATVDTFRDPRTARSFETLFMGAVNENFASQTSDNVREVFDFKREQGRFIGAFAPYGYDKDPQNSDLLIIDDMAAIVVQDIFMWYTYDGMSKGAIAKRLNEKGVPNPTLYKRLSGLNYCNPHLQENDGLWNATTVARILGNPVYIGTMVQGRQKITSYSIHTREIVPKKDWKIKEGTHAPIIDLATFETAQLLSERDTRTAPTSQQLHLFSGLMKCADCGKAMTRKVSKGMAYYACSTHTRKLASRCSKHSIREDKVEMSVLAAIQMQVALVEDMSEKVREINENPVTKKESILIQNLLEQKENELIKVTRLSDGLYPDLKAGIISKDEYTRLKAGYLEEIRHLQTSIQKLQQENYKAENGVTNDSPYLNSFLRYRNITSLTRAVLVELVNAVYVYEGGKLEIEFRFVDEFQRIQEFIDNNQDVLAGSTLLAI